jgi:hypothetical protein
MKRHEETRQIQKAKRQRFVRAAAFCDFVVFTRAQIRYLDIRLVQKARRKAWRYLCWESVALGPECAVHEAHPMTPRLPGRSRSER